MSKNGSPVERLFEGALLLGGATLIITWSLATLERIWGWILLVALIAAALAVGGVLLLRWLRGRADRW